MPARHIRIEQRRVHEVGARVGDQCVRAADGAESTSTAGQRDDLRARLLNRREPHVVAFVQIGDVELYAGAQKLRRERSEGTFGAPRDEAVDQVEDVHCPTTISASTSCHRRTDAARLNCSAHRRRAAAPKRCRRSESTTSVRTARNNPSKSSTGTTYPVSPSITTSARSRNGSSDDRQTAETGFDQHTRHPFGRSPRENQDVRSAEQPRDVGDVAEHVDAGILPGHLDRRQPRTASPPSPPRHPAPPIAAFARPR